MPCSVADRLPAAHPLLPDIGKPVVAKATVRIPDIDDRVWERAVGRAIQRAVAVAGLSNKEAAALVGVDDAEFGKWISATRRPHLDRVLAVRQLRGPCVIALAEEIARVDASLDVVTEIRVRRVL